MSASFSIEPRTVLMTTDTLGGVWNYCVELAAALAAEGVVTILAAMGGRPSSDQRKQAGKLPATRFLESEFRLEWMEHPWEDVDRAGKWLKELEAEHQPDLIHLNNFAQGDVGWRAPVLMVGHSCVLSWWEAVKGSRAPAEWDRYADRVRSGLHAADLVVAPTCAMMAALNLHHGPFQQTRVIPNASDAARFQPGRKEPFILAAGRLWDEAKNVAALESVAGSLAWPVRLAGPLGREALSNSHVTYLGPLTQSEMADEMARASVYALPARYEPFGLSILEAALSGCALVLGDIPSLRENWSGCALFVDPNNADELRRALTLLSRDEAFRDCLAAAAMERASKFGTKEMAASYLDAYRSTWAAAALK